MQFVCFITHTSCFKFQSLIATESTLKCPMCRKTAVGVDKAESLPNNVHAEHNILLNKKLEQAEANSKMLLVFKNYLVVKI
jgi:hypothetical protein